MIVHEAVSVTDPVVTFINVTEGVQKIDPVLFALEDGLPLIAAGSDMINSAGVLYAERTGHAIENIKEKRQSQTLKT
jgi:hypothetical protein